MKRLLSDAHQIAAHAVVNNSLLGHIRQFSVDLEDSDSGCDYHRQLTGSVKTAIQVVLFKN